MKQKILSVLLAIAVALGSLPFHAAAADAMSDADAAAAVKEEIAKYTIANAPIFPYTYEGVDYTNFAKYLKAWALNNTGREITLSYDKPDSTTYYTDWSTGSAVQYKMVPFDEDGEMIEAYYKDNAAVNQFLYNMSVTCGDVTEPIGKIVFMKASSLQQTPEKIVQWWIDNLPFARIQNGNPSQNEVTLPLGEKSGSSTSLPIHSAAGMLYSGTTVNVAWTLEHVSGDANAMKMSTSRVITIARPAVGEDAAVFKLIATVTSKTDETVSQTKEFVVSVPAYEAVTIPVQIPEGATLTLKEGTAASAPVVAQKYVKKIDGAPAGYELYECTLHAGNNSTTQTYSYVVSRDGYITANGTFGVSDAGLPTQEIDLTPSSEDDTKLASLVLTSPGSGSSALVKGLSFDPDTEVYDLEVKGVQSVTFAGAAAVTGADVKITSYYKTLANANKGTLTTTGGSLTSACYLPDAADTTSVIVITVTAPAGSTQAETERTYTINVKKSAASSPMTGLTLTASSTVGGTVCGRVKDFIEVSSGIDAEEQLTPAFVAGGTETLYRYSVNYYRDQIKVKPTAAGATIKVNEETVTSGRDSSVIPLNVGDNIITVTVTKDGTDTVYPITVHRKEKFYLTDITSEVASLQTVPADDGKSWTASAGFAHDVATLPLTFETNIAGEDVDVYIAIGDTILTGKAGEPINIPVGSDDTVMPIVCIARTVNGVREAQSFVVGLRRQAATGADAVESYLPAPGQFVNLESYGTPGRTLTGASMVTLGAFGGNIVYRFNEPVRNDPANPYGIDFIVTGNAFTNADGSTAAGAAEPAAVMVSEDGSTWYELAGSEYYTASARHGLTVTYTNGDLDFAAAADTPWVDSDGERGILPKNDYHTQPYYPNPQTYAMYQNGVGANASYTAQSVSFTGTMIDDGFYPFGYADSHSVRENSKLAKNLAANPYVKNHNYVYNADGFDLAWAVDDAGDPVVLNEVRYVRIYNPVMAYGGATGEKSSEIQNIQKAQPMENAVGVSGGLSALSVNGEDVALTAGTYTYTIDGQGASSLQIAPVAQNADANIYVSNEYVESGAASTKLPAVDKTRIIVQEGSKEPVIYILNFTNVASAASNADLASLVLTPGDVKQTPDAQDAFSFRVANNVSAVRLAATPSARKSSMTLSAPTLAAHASLQRGEESPTLSLEVGANVFTITVTSENQALSKTYTVEVTRDDAASGPSTGTIAVSFSLTGDDGKVWIASRTTEVPEGSSVKYLTDMMLNNAGLDYTVVNGNYISSINGLSEFDKGPNSGWMYRVNGKLAEMGYAETFLKKGDVVSWFYTNDWTQEPGAFGGGGGGAVTPAADALAAYKDVKPGDWYYDYVRYVVENKLMYGVSDDEFGVNLTTSRAMVVTILYNLAGRPAANSAGDFDDVASGQWYADAVAWALQNGIVSGYGNGRFGPNDPVTREQFAVILYGFAKLKGYHTDKKSDLSSYEDVASIDAWALPAMEWAHAAGLMTGRSERSLAPLGETTRAEAATIFMQFIENVK